MKRWKANRDRKVLRRLGLVLPILIFLWVGCSQQEFARGFPRLTPAKVSEALISDPAHSRPKTRSEKFVEVLAQWRAQSASAREADYLVGAGDILAISVVGVEAPGRTTTLEREVSLGGMITLPFTGEVGCLDRTTSQIEAQVKGLYGTDYIREPEVNVSVREYKGRTVTVVGAVERPGIYVLSRNYSTVLELLVKAGGVSKDAGDELVILRPGQEGDAPVQDGTGGSRREKGSRAESGIDAAIDEKDASILKRSGREITVNLRELLDEGDLSLNVEVCDGNIMRVPPAQMTYVTVLGYVRSPRSFPLREGEAMSVTRALSLAGSLAPNACAENSILVRRTESGQKAYPIDLTAIVRGEGPMIYLQPEDTIIVGSSLAMKFMEKIFQPSIGVSAGVGWSP